MAVTIDRVRLISYNMHGFSQGRPAIDEIIGTHNPDIIAIQEHWLTPSNLNKFDDAFPSYYMFGCSAMTKTLELGMLKGRPFGGVLFMIKHELRNSVELIACAERHAIIRVSNCVVVNLYLPCTGTVDRMPIVEDILIDSLSICDRFPECNYIFVGDFNAELSSNSDGVAKYLNMVIEENDFYRCDVLFNKSGICTYDNIALNNRSAIDYILSSSKDIITAFEIVDPDINFSDHYPLMVDCKIPNVRSGKIGHAIYPKCTSRIPLLRWDHADLSSYYHYTGRWLQPVLTRLDSINKSFVDHELSDLSLIHI